MALASYGVLAGSVIDQRAEGGTDSPHYQIRIRGGDADFRLAVNVLSQEKPAELLYVADENFRHPVTQSLPGLPADFTPLASQPGGMALDFIRANLFDRQQMQAVRASVPGPDNDLADKLDHFGRIVAALVNPPGPAPEAETVMLLNASPQQVDLTGWSILDRDKRQMMLHSGLLAPGDSVRVQVAAPVQLGNRGGLITLLNPYGLKVDGVAYTQAQAAAEGWRIVF